MKKREQLFENADRHTPGWDADSMIIPRPIVKKVDEYWDHIAYKNNR